MKLLLDENIPRRVVAALQREFPGTSQIALVGLERTSDRVIWDFAKANGYVIVTSDADFEEMSLVLGCPPHVIRIEGNLSNPRVVQILAGNATAIRSRIEDDGLACVNLGGG